MVASTVLGPRGNSARWDLRGGRLVKGRPYRNCRLSSDGWIARISSDGQLQWAKALDTPNHFSELGSVAVTDGGNFVAVGTVGKAGASDASRRGWLVGFDGSGARLTERRLVQDPLPTLSDVVIDQRGWLWTTAFAGLTDKTKGLVLRTDPWGNTTCDSGCAVSKKSLKSCVGGDLCKPATCVANKGCTTEDQSASCDDGDKCTADVCSPLAGSGGCKHVPIPGCF